MNADTPPPDAPVPSPVPPVPPAPPAHAVQPDHRRATRDRRQRSIPVVHERRSGIDRRASQGKRAGEYDLDADTLEFVQAVHRFKEESGRSFPSWSDILGILKALGYEKRI